MPCCVLGAVADGGQLGKRRRAAEPGGCCVAGGAALAVAVGCPVELGGPDFSRKNVAEVVGG